MKKLCIAISFLALTQTSAFALNFINDMQGVTAKVRALESETMGEEVTVKPGTQVTYAPKANVKRSVTWIIVSPENIKPVFCKGLDQNLHLDHSYRTIMLEKGYTCNTYE